MVTRRSRKRSLGGGDGDSNWLPDGWKVEFKARKSGDKKGKRYKCYVDSQGHKCYSKSQVFAYLEKIRTDNNAIIRIPDGAKSDCMKFLAPYEEWEMIISKRRRQSSEEVIVRKFIRIEGGHTTCVESEMPDNDWPDWLPDDWTYSISKAAGKQNKRYSTHGAPSFSYRYQVLAYLEKIARKEAHENTDNANRSTLDLSMEPENEVIGSSPGEPPAKLATRSSKRKSLAMQGAEGVSGGESGSSSAKESGAVELPWIIFCSAVGALYYRKIWEEDPEDENLKEKLEVAEEDVHFMRESFPEDVPEDWKYNHETASNIVSRRNGDSGGELISIATALEEKINEKRNRKRNCSGPVSGAATVIDASSAELMEEGLNLTDQSKVAVMDKLLAENLGKNPKLGHTNVLPPPATTGLVTGQHEGPIDTSESPDTPDQDQSSEESEESEEREHIFDFLKEGMELLNDSDKRRLSKDQVDVLNRMLVEHLAKTTNVEGSRSQQRPIPPDETEKYFGIQVENDSPNADLEDDKPRDNYDDMTSFEKVADSWSNNVVSTVDKDRDLKDLSGDGQKSHVESPLHDFHGKGGANSVPPMSGPPKFPPDCSYFKPASDNANDIPLVFDPTLDNVPKHDVNPNDLAGHPDSPKTQQPRSYASIFQDATNIRRTGKLRFIPPVFTEIGYKHAIIPDDLIIKQSEHWLLTLVGCFVGKRPAFPFVHFHAFRLWKKYGLVDVVLNNQGRFYFKFDSAEGLDFVINNRPWLFNDVPVLLKKWEVGIENDKIIPTSVHMWVNIYDLDSNMWDYDIMSHITSVIGVPVTLDRFTEEMIEKKSGRAMYARVLIKVNADHDIPAFVEARVLGKMQRFRLQYLWKPDRCSHCAVFGHKFINCVERPKSTEEMEAGAPRTTQTNVAGPSGTKTHDKQVSHDEQGFQQPKRRRRRSKKAQEVTGTHISKPKVKYVPKRPERPTTSKSKALTTAPDNATPTESSQPVRETPDTHSDTYAISHQDIPSSAAPGATTVKQSERANRRFGAVLSCRWAKYRKTLRVENLHFSTDEVDFTKIFKAFGPVLAVEFPKDPEKGHCKGLAYIEFVKLEHAKAAAQSLNGTEIAGQTIKILSCADYLEAPRQGEKAAGLLP